MGIVAVGVEDWELQLQDERLVLVEFWAPWCPWCRRLNPELEELAKEYDGRMKFLKVNVEDHPSLADRYSIQGLPTIRFFCKGRPVGELVGYLPKPQLRSRIDQMLQIYNECLERSSRRG